MLLIHFLFADTGAERAPVTAWVSPVNTRDRRYEIILRDRQTDALRYVYAFFWNGTPPALSTDYVDWTADTGFPVDPCTSDAPTEACGTVDSDPAGLSGLNTYRTHFDGNWITDEFSVKSGASYYPDLWNRIEYKMNGESEDSWSSTGGGRRFLGIIDGPVRVIRAVQGAQSGEHTTKYEYHYPTQFHTRINLRVHPLEIATLNLRMDHEQGVADDSNEPFGDMDTWIWTASFVASAGAAYDEVEGKCGAGECLPVGNDEFWDWTEVASEARGSYVSIVRDPRPIDSASKQYIYADEDNQGMVGEFGRQWVDMGNMQDGIDNAGACNPSDDPEGIFTALHFRRVGFVIYPQPLRSDTSLPTAPPRTPDQLQKNERLPMFALANRQIKNVPDPPAPAPCVPLVTATNTGSGTVNLTLTTTSCTGMKGYRLYSAEGTAPLAFLHDLGAGTTFTDRRAKRGATHRYAATAYNGENIEGANSTEVSLAVTDTTSPAIPVSLVGTAGDQSATVVWAPNWENDLHGFNFYIATNAGGPFSKANGTVINAALSPEWTQGGLANGQTYYIKVTAVDFSGNESAQSAAVDVTPSP